MTKEEILKMEAGVKLNALVTREVMGYETRHTWQYKPHYADLDGGWQMNPYWWCNFCEEHKWRKTKPAPGVCPARILPYSTNISAAWQVVERMRENIEKDGQFTDEWWAFVRGFGEFYIEHLMRVITPETICKAALLAKLKGGE